jgi:hypothetical protein
VGVEAYLITLFPEPAIGAEVCWRRVMAQREREHTFSMDPHEGSGFLPLREYEAFSKPFCGALVVEATCGVVVYGWIWGGEPLSKLLSQVIPCKGI